MGTTRQISTWAAVAVATLAMSACTVTRPPVQPGPSASKSQPSASATPSPSAVAPVLKMVALSAADLPTWTAGGPAVTGDLASICGKGVGVFALTTARVESGVRAPNGLPVVVRVSRTGPGKAADVVAAALASLTDCPMDGQGDLLTSASLAPATAATPGVGANLLTTNGAGATTDSRGYFIAAAGTDLVVEVLVTGDVSVAGDFDPGIMTSFSEAVVRAALAKVSGKTILVPPYPDVTTAAGVVAGNAVAAPAGDDLGNSAGPGDSSGDVPGGVPTP